MLHTSLAVCPTAAGQVRPADYPKLPAGCRLSSVLAGSKGQQLPLCC